MCLYWQRKQRFMKKLLTAFSFIILLSSCQKEINFDSGNGGTGSGGNGGGGNTSGLLVKTIAVTGTETQTTLYTYDAQKRLETMTISGTSGGMALDSYTKYFRDGSGRIVKVIQKLADLMGVPSDTSVRIYHYPDATTRDYDYSVQDMSINMGGMTMSTIDSSVYTYTAGKMSSFRSFMSSSLAPGVPMMESRTDFNYDASNKVTGMKVYNDASNPGGPLELFADYKYTYASTSVSNVYMAANGAQNFALNGLPNTSTNIITKMETVSNAVSPALTVVITTTYVNGAGNKPVSGTAVSVTTGQPTQTTNYSFFYQ